MISKESFKNVLFIQLGTVDPTRVFNAIYPYARILFTKGWVIGVAIASLVAAWIMWDRRDQLVGNLATIFSLEGASWISLLLLYVILFLIVVAHEFGHHVQHILGITDRVQQDRRSGANSASVALELQADCFAGIWGHDASQGGRFQAGRVELEPGDADEALQAAASIGDDRLQKMSTGRVVPESFTHGSSRQRVTWFRRGLENGDIRACDTFADGPR